MSTLVLSDLHLGAGSRADIARLPEVRERLLAALDGVDHLVLLGDLVELRDRPLAYALDVAAPVLSDIGDAMAGRRVTLAGGNHDHALAEPWLAARRLEGGELGVAQTWPVVPGEGTAGRLAELMPEVELSFAYPGLWLRDDVYAMHGHYLDVHLTVPRIESVAASVMRRVSGERGELSQTAQYEAALAPIYAFIYAAAQGGPRSPLRKGGAVSRSVWQSVNPNGSQSAGARLRALLLGRVTIPGAVMAMNRLGLGPFGPDISGEELRRSGLRAMGEVADSLGLGADHVVFGHTHRVGPLPGDDQAEWRSPAGARLWNTGCWYYEPALTGRGPGGPYWPGTGVRLDETGPPRPESMLEGVALADPRQDAGAF